MSPLRKTGLFAASTECGERLSSELVSSTSFSDVWLAKTVVSFVRVGILSSQSTKGLPSTKSTALSKIVVESPSSTTSNVW